MKKKGQMALMVGLAVGAIIMVVILGVIFEFIRDNSLELTTVTNESIDITSTDNTVINESITLSSGAAVLGNTSVTNITFFGNGTGLSTEDAEISVGTHVNFTVDGSIIVNQDNFSDDDAIVITYIYTTDGVGQAANDDIVASSFFGNPDISTEDTGIAFNSEVNITRPGVITVKTHNFTDTKYNYTYQTEPSGFLSTGTTRTIVSTISILLAIVILVFLASFVSTRV